MTRIVVASLAALLMVGMAPSAASAAQKAAGATVQVKKHKPVTGGGVTGVGGNTVVNLTSWDCKAVGGTVVIAGDNRCGASGKYCRMPDTNAVCIEEKAQ